MLVYYTHKQYIPTAYTHTQCLIVPKKIISSVPGSIEKK